MKRYRPRRTRRYFECYTAPLLMDTQRMFCAHSSKYSSLKSTLTLSVVNFVTNEIKYCLILKCSAGQDYCRHTTVDLRRTDAPLLFATIDLSHGRYALYMWRPYVRGALVAYRLGLEGEAQAISILPWKTSHISVAQEGAGFYIYDYNRQAIASKICATGIDTSGAAVSEERKLIFVSGHHNYNKGYALYGYSDAKDPVMCTFNLTNGICSITYQPEDQLIIMMNYAGYVSIRDVRRLCSPLQDDFHVHPKGVIHTPPVACLRRGVCASVGKGELRIWEYATGKILLRSPGGNSASGYHDTAISYFPPGGPSAPPLSVAAVLDAERQEERCEFILERVRAGLGVGMHPAPLCCFGWGINIE